MTWHESKRFKMPETLAAGVFEALRGIDRSVLFILVINRFDSDGNPATPRQPRCEPFNRDVDQCDEQQES